MRRTISVAFAAMAPARSLGSSSRASAINCRPVAKLSAWAIRASKVSRSGLGMPRNLGEKRRKSLANLPGFAP